jgi:hypothetical protein
MAVIRNDSTFERNLAVAADEASFAGSFRENHLLARQEEKVVSGVYSQKWHTIPGSNVQYQVSKDQNINNQIIGANNGSGSTASSDLNAKYTVKYPDGLSLIFDDGGVFVLKDGNLVRGRIGGLTQINDITVKTRVIPH